MLALPYGRGPYPLALGDRRVSIVEPPTPPAAPPLRVLLDAALDAPIGRPRMESLIQGRARVTVIVSDATRAEPRAALFAAVRDRLPSATWTLAIATGTHGPSGVTALGLPDSLLSGVRVIDHDGHDERELVSLGTTSRGTPVRLHRCLLESDLVIATGCIRPHYFAGFGAGAKAIFPGLGGAAEIRINHRLKLDPNARAGIVEDNPCRSDLEEAASMLAVPTFLLDGVCASDGSIQAAVAGDPVLAFRRGAELARPWFTVEAAPASLVIASDSLPVTSTLYQSAKIAAAVAPLVRENGWLVLVAECADGVGPLDVVNDAIFRIGILPRLARGSRVGLISALPESVVRQTLVEPLASIEPLLSRHIDCVIIPRASQLLVRVPDDSSRHTRPSYDALR
jgi:lactate racemase